MPSSAAANPLVRRIVLLALLVIAAVVGGYLFSDWYTTVPDTVTRSFVGRAACIECHQEQADLFHGSHHDLAMDLATEETVLASFDGQEIEHYGITSKVFRDGDRYMVNTDGPDGTMQDFEVKYVFGVEPLQQYMVELRRDPHETMPDNQIGQLQVLRLSWDTKHRKWFYLSPPDVKQKLEPDDPLHWTGIMQRWNTSCASCHSTNLQKNYDSLSRTYKTTFSEIDVSCEACHGPGSLHVQLARNHRIFWDRKQGYGLSKLKTSDNVVQVETCAPCHSRRTEICNGFVAGNRYDDYFAVQLLSDQMYHHDGQIRDEDYVYGSFIQSKMFHQGIQCSDCHDPHSTRLKNQGNRVCTSCHQHPAGKYDSPNHHHHLQDSEAAQCVACHMPSTTYMDIDPRRDHSFRVPRPDLSVLYRTPNACTGCHIDITKIPESERDGLMQYLDWIIKAENGNEMLRKELDSVNRLMLEAVEKWFPTGEDATPKTAYYADLTIGKSDSGDALPTLRRLAVDRKAPAIFRASALEGLADNIGPESLVTAMDALKDPDPKVVVAALWRVDAELNRQLNRMQYGASGSDSQRQLEKLTTAVVGLLNHKSRRVRIEAARIAASVPTEIRDRYARPDERKAFQLALEEYKQRLSVDSDRAGSHMMMGGLYEMLGNQEKAMDSYRTAIGAEPNVAGLRPNLAALLENRASQIRREMGRATDITAVRAQEFAMQAQQLVEQATQFRLEEHELLKKDIRRAEGLPNTHGLEYRFAMSCYLQGDLEQTEKHLLIALGQQPENTSYLLALATFFQQQKKPDQAIKYANRLVQIDPLHRGFRRLANDILAELNSNETEAR